MKRFLIAATLAAAALSASVPAAAQVSVSIGQPGFYGRLDIGGFPAPPLLFPQPMMIERVPVGRPPLYLRVPPGHSRNWRKYCHRYNACGERVFFVQDNWYQQEYAPRYQERRGGYRNEYRGEERRHFDREERREERRDYRRDERRYDRGDDRRDYRGDDRGHGHGHGHDHDR
ncbi:MAG: hypothetical protein IPJ12_13250 [Betaproteobacteria bacterium]|nr:hypothetical protein [Betaproteobacteria bacterium]